MNQPESIDEYLDRLADALTTSPRTTRRILLETEDHLVLTRQALIDSGVDPAAAEAQALQQFGDVSTTAQGFNRQAAAALLPRFEAIGTPLLGLFSIGLIAIGISGLLALVIGLAAGKPYVSGDPPGVTYTATRCADLLEYHPEAPDCGTAAVRHHFDEVVSYRVAAGILGLMALAAYVAMKRLRRPSRMPAAFAPTIGASIFGMAGAGLTLSALGQMLTGTPDGAGQYLSGGIIALLVALVCGLRLLPLLTPPPSDEDAV